MELWHGFDEKLPDYDRYILTELSGCKVVKFVIMKLRQGEGFAHYKKWRYLNEREK